MGFEVPQPTRWNRLWVCARVMMQLHYIEKWFHYPLSPLKPRNCLEDSCFILVWLGLVKTSDAVCSCLCETLLPCTFAGLLLEILLQKQKLAGNYGAFPGGLHWRKWDLSYCTHTYTHTKTHKLCGEHSGPFYFSSSLSKSWIENRRCCEGSLIGDTCWKKKH